MIGAEIFDLRADPAKLDLDFRTLFLDAENLQQARKDADMTLERLARVRIWRRPLGAFNKRHSRPRGHFENICGDLGAARLVQSRYLALKTRVTSEPALANATAQSVAERNRVDDQHALAFECRANAQRARMAHKLTRNPGERGRDARRGAKADREDHGARLDLSPVFEGKLKAFARGPRRET